MILPSALFNLKKHFFHSNSISVARTCIGNIFDVGNKLTTVCIFFFVGSKLTAGIHKLADTLTKTGKKKTFDRQNTPTSLTENQSEDEVEQVSYVDRQSSAEYLLNGDDEKKTKEQEVVVQNGGINDEEEPEEEPEEYLQLVREPSNEEKEVELKVQQKIDALRRGEEASQPVRKHLFINYNNYK